MEISAVILMILFFAWLFSRSGSQSKTEPNSFIVTSMSSEDFTQFYLDTMDEIEAADKQRGYRIDHDGYRREL